jgi:hypothetical protein
MNRDRGYDLRDHYFKFIYVSEDLHYRRGRSSFDTFMYSNESNFEIESEE